MWIVDNNIFLQEKPGLLLFLSSLSIIVEGSPSSSGPETQLPQESPGSHHSVCSRCAGSPQEAHHPTQSCRRQETRYEKFRTLLRFKHIGVLHKLNVSSCQ